MPAGASPKREREYKKLKNKFKKSGRYKGREEEVASRIVNKQRSQFGETKKAKKQLKQGKSLGRNLPIPDYQHLTVGQVAKKLDELSSQDIKKIKKFEQKHKNRKTLMQKLERKLSA